MYDLIQGPSNLQKIIFGQNLEGIKFQSKKIESLNEEFEHIKSFDKLKYEKICLQNERESIQKRIEIIHKKINKKLPNLIKIKNFQI